MSRKYLIRSIHGDQRLAEFSDLVGCEILNRFMHFPKSYIVYVDVCRLARGSINRLDYLIAI